MSTQSEDEIRGILRQEIYHLKGGTVSLDAIRDDLPLFDVNEQGVENLGLDSLDSLELAMVAEEKLGVAVSDSVDFKDLATVDDIVGFLVRLCAQTERSVGGGAPSAERLADRTPPWSHPRAS